jgi:LacI family transcriptional regulator
MAVSHLLEQGYHHVGHLTGPLDWWEARERKAAWNDVLKDAKLEVKDEHWVEGNWSSASGALAIEKLLTQYPEIDAVFVANDQMALSVMQFACRSGLRIPDDLGVVGFDDIPESGYFWPPLTTIRQDQYNIGEVAVEEIITQIESKGSEHKHVQPSILVAPALIIRQSSIRR